MAESTNKATTTRISTVEPSPRSPSLPLQVLRGAPEHHNDNSPELMSSSKPKDSAVPLKKRNIVKIESLKNHLRIHSVSSKGQVSYHDNPRSLQGNSGYHHPLRATLPYNQNRQPQQQQQTGQYSTACHNSNVCRDEPISDELYCPDHDENFYFPSGNAPGSEQIVDRRPVLRPKQKWSTCPTRKDVICTKHRTSTKHPGNQYYQDLIKQHVDMLATKSNPLIFDKFSAARVIVETIRRRKGMFLFKYKENEAYWDIGDVRAMRKTYLLLKHHKAFKTQKKEQPRDNSTTSETTEDLNSSHITIQPHIVDTLKVLAEKPDCRNTLNEAVKLLVIPPKPSPTSWKESRGKKTYNTGSADSRNFFEADAATYYGRKTHDHIMVDKEDTSNDVTRDQSNDWEWTTTEARFRSSYPSAMAWKAPQMLKHPGMPAVPRNIPPESTGSRDSRIFPSQPMLKRGRSRSFTGSDTSCASMAPPHSQHHNHHMPTVARQPSFRVVPEPRFIRKRSNSFPLTSQYTSYSDQSYDHAVGEQSDETLLPLQIISSPFCNNMTPTQFPNRFYRKGPRHPHSQHPCRKDV